MHRVAPARRHTRSSGLIVAAVIAAIAYPRVAAAAATQLPLPPVLASMHDFRGRVDYLVRRDGSGVAVSGSLVVGAQGWSLDERTQTFDLRADSAGAHLTPSNGSDTVVADVIDSDVLSNAWTALLGDVASAVVSRTESSGMWDAGALHVFLDQAGAQVIGFRESGADDVAYTLDDWWTVGPIEVPHRILRLRDGVPTASYTVSSYRVTAAVAPAADAARPYVPAMDLPHKGEADEVDLGPQIDVGRGQRLAAVAFAAFVLALGIVAWTRRDALVAAWCVRIARDPRGWRTAGVSIFVEPDGALVLDGSRYRVGAAFYNRAVLVQRSALFIRVTSPAVPHAVVLPRRFTKLELGVRPQRRRPVAGFTLIETIVATALFAAIILLAVYPAIAAVAHADAIAAERAEAATIASNALADEEAATAYGGASLGTTTTSVDGLVLTVRVSPGTIRDESDLDIVVADQNGDALAHVVSWLGIAVTAPPGSAGGPPVR